MKFDLFNKEFPHEPSFLENMKLGNQVFTELQQVLGFHFPHEYIEFMSILNGGYFRKGILHIFSLGYQATELDLIRWNMPNGWKKYYSLSAQKQNYDINKIIFFAENIVGDQFGFNLNSPTPNGFEIIFMFASDGTIFTIGDSFSELLNVILPLEYAEMGQEKFLPIEKFNRFVQNTGKYIGPGNHLNHVFTEAYQTDEELAVSESIEHLSLLGQMRHRALLLDLQ